MCYVITCQKCNKLSWRGCGNHLESIKKQIPINNRCNCKLWK